MNTKSQTNAPDSSKPEANTFLLAEYDALREEILKRVEFQHQILSLTLLIFGTVLSFGLQAHSSSIVLVYPILASFLAANWVHNGLGVRNLGIYIRNQIEAKVGENGIGWEHRARPLRRPLGGLNFFSARGIFIGTSILAIILAISLTKLDLVDIILFVIAVSGVAYSIIILRRSPRQKSDSYRHVPARHEEESMIEK